MIGAVAAVLNSKHHPKIYWAPEEWQGAKIQASKMFESFEGGWVSPLHFGVGKTNPKFAQLSRESNKELQMGLQVLSLQYLSMPEGRLL